MDSREPVKMSRRKVIKMGVLGTAALSVGALGLTGIKLKTTSTVQAHEEGEQIGFLYDQTKCVGCRVCQAACKETNNWEEGVEWRRVLTSETRKNVFLSISCNHCENPACANVCPVGAYTKRTKDGIVIQNPDKCIGCKYCMYACPYQAPQFSDKTGRVSKCHFCYERQDRGELPACVENCPMGALKFGKISELRKTYGETAQVPGVPEPEITNPSWVIIPKE